MEYRKIFISVIIFFIAIIISLAGCSAPLFDTKQPNKENTRNSETDSVQSNKTITPETDSENALSTSIQEKSKRQKYIDTKESKYFFINGALLGSCDNQGWHSLCNTKDHINNNNDNSVIFYAKDILNKDAFYIYKNQEIIGKSTQIIWETENTGGLGCFEDEDAPEKFAKYGELYHFQGNSHTTDRIFNLPVNLGNDLSNLEIPNYSFYTYFVYGERWKPDDSYDTFATNSTLNLFPKSLSFDSEPTKEGMEVLSELFKENHMENTSTNFTKTVIGDFDNDDKDEYLMIANSPRGENGWLVIVGEGEKDKVGTFSVILYQDDNGSVQILHKDLSPVDGTVKFTNGIISVLDIDHSIDYCHQVDLSMIADMNGDRMMEIIIHNYLWEGGYSQAYSQNTTGVYEPVLRSNWGM